MFSCVALHDQFGSHDHEPISRVCVKIVRWNGLGRGRLLSVYSIEHRYQSKDKENILTKCEREKKV